MKKIMIALGILVPSLLMAEIRYSVSSDTTRYFYIEPAFSTIRRGKIHYESPFNHEKFKAKTTMCFYAPDKSWQLVSIDAPDSTQATLTAAAASMTNCAEVTASDFNARRKMVIQP